MDSLTQIALGGAVGYAVLGRQQGRKAILWGAALGTLPDLDVLIPYGGEVENFTYHRGFSHSLLVQLLVTPFFAWLASKIHPTTSPCFQRWCVMIYLTLSSHALLDTCTVYGTQLFWPVTEFPFSFDNLFIIDPLYTLPLLVGTGLAFSKRLSASTKQKMNLIGLGISSVYILWSFIGKALIDDKIEHAMTLNGIEAQHYISSPAALNTLLWRAVIVQDTQYYEVYASVFDKPNEVSFDVYPTEPERLRPIQDAWHIQRLKWFTKGLFKVQEIERNIILSDLRMGVECAYAFNFVVGQIQVGPEGSKKTVNGPYTKITERPNLSAITDVWARIWNPQVSLAPVNTC
jgi:inner membrane protein